MCTAAVKERKARSLRLSHDVLDTWPQSRTPSPECCNALRHRTQPDKSLGVAAFYEDGQPRLGRMGMSFGVRRFGSDDLVLSLCEHSVALGYACSRSQSPSPSLAISHLITTRRICRPTHFCRRRVIASIGSQSMWRASKHTSRNTRK